MASENYLEDALNAEVDETAVNALMKSLEIQLDRTTMQESNHAETSREVIKPSVNIKREKGNQQRVQDNVTKVEFNSTEPHYDTVSNAKPMTQERNRPTDLPRIINTPNTNISGHMQSNNGGPHGISQGQTVTPLKFQENAKSIYCAGNQLSGNRVTFQPGLIQNRNLGHSILSSQSLLKMTSTMPNVLNMTEQQNPPASPVMIQLANIPGLEHVKPEGRSVMLRGSSNTNVTSGPPLLMSVVPVPMATENVGTSSDSHVTSSNSSSTSIAGVPTLPKPTAGVPPTMERTSSSVCPPNLQIVNVIPLRPETPAKQEQKNVPSRVVISTPQMPGNRTNPANIVPVTTHKGQIGAPTQGHLLLKAQNGQYQWVRVNLATTKPGIAIAPNSKTNATITPGPTLVSKTAGQEAMQAPQPTILTQNAKGQYIVDNTCKDKCHKFLTKILELASNESQTVQKSINNLVQDLIDAKIEPDYFCRCLEVLLNSKSTHCLVDFLKRSLPIFRIALATKEVVLGGIRPPAYQLGLPQSSPTMVVPQLQPLQQSSHSMPQPTSQQQSILIQRHNEANSLLKNQDLMWQAQMRSQLPPKNNNSTLQLPNHVNLISPANVLPQNNNQPCYGQSIVRQQGSTLQSFPTRLLQPQTPVSVSTSTQSPAASILQFSSSTLPLEINSAKTSSNIAESSTNRHGEIDERKLNIKEENEDMPEEENKESHCNSADVSFLNIQSLQSRINKIALAHGLEESTPEVVAFISQACRQKMKNVLQKLSDIAEHRSIKFYNNVQTDVVHGVQGQLKFLEEVDKLKSKNQDSSDGKLDMSDQARLKAKFKKGLKAEMKELRQQEANQTALQAIGFRKKPKLENGSDGNNLQLTDSKTVFAQNPRRSMGLLRRFKRVTVKDLIWFLEQERHALSKKLLYKAYNNW